MNDKNERKKIRSLILEFLSFEIPEDPFVARFMRLWKKERDAQWSIKSTWNEPLLDKQLQAEFLDKRISPDEFTRRWNELWGFTGNDVEFHDMIDTIFSACDDYRPDRGSDSEFEKDKLRASVTEAFRSYFNGITTSKDGVEVSARRSSRPPLT